MNVGLLYTPVSIYQMTRGALVLFVGVLSVLFLSRRLWLYQYVASLPLREARLTHPFPRQMALARHCHGRCRRDLSLRSTYETRCHTTATDVLLVPRQR